MSEEVYKLMELQRSRHRIIMEQLHLFDSIVNNTKLASWWELLLVKAFGTPAGGLIYDKRFYNYIEYNSKLYYIPNENSTTDLHS